MSDGTRLTPAEVAQTSANLRLAAQFVREIITAPEFHNVLPDRATVVLFPGDEAENQSLSEDNMKLATNIAREGESVATWKVGLPTSTGPKLLAR